MIGALFFLSNSFASSHSLAEFVLEVERISLQDRVAKLSGGAILQSSDWTLTAPEGTLYLSETFAIESGQLSKGIIFSWRDGTATATNGTFNKSQVSLNGNVVVVHGGHKMTGSEFHIKRSPFELLCINDCKVETLHSSDNAGNK